MSKGHVPGGGAASNKVTERPIRTGVGNLGVSVGATGQLGQKQGSHTTEGKETSYRGAGPIHQGAALRPAEMGNTLAAQTTCGPGGSRKEYGSGSQQQYGNANPGNARAKSTDILSQFGPDYKR